MFGILQTLEINFFKQDTDKTTALQKIISYIYNIPLNLF